ncbi:unnamed protein product, partial [Thlaspi arvense]
MGDKEKNRYSQWSPEETKVLIELLVESIQRGWRDQNGILHKPTVEHKILPALNEKLGCQKNHKHYLSRIKYLKSQYQCYGHPSHKFLRYDSIDQFEDLKIIFDCAIANGGSSVGLGDTTDARTFKTADSQVKESLNFDDSNGDEFVLPSEQQSAEYAASPSSEKNLNRRVEKHVPRKRSRTDAFSSSDEIKNYHTDAMVMVSNKILTVIQQREERQQKEVEKREAEKNKISFFSFYHNIIVTCLYLIMESITEEEEHTYVEEKTDQMEEDESDLDIVLLMLNNIANAYLKNGSRIQRPIRRLITTIGYDYIQKALKEDPHHFRSVYQSVHVGALESQQIEYANNWRDTIALSMWNDAMETGSQH